MKIPHSFLEYAESVEIYLLNDDVRFIEKTLSGTQKGHLRRILKWYLDVWSHEMSKAPPHKRNNIGRRAANEWLREASKVGFGPPECSQPRQK